MLIKKQKIPVKELLLIGLLPSFFKKAIYKLKGYQIGKDVSIGFGSVIIGNKVSIKNNSSIGHFTIIRAREIDIERYVKIGSFTFIDTEKVFINDDARINEQVIIGGIKNPDSYIKIGKRTIIMEYSFINPTKPIEIGDDSGIGGHCLLFTHGSWLSQLDGYPVTFAPITLGKNVWLPWRVFIMPGVSVGDNVVIGANSLVTKSLPSNCLAAGSPANIIKENYPSALSKERRDEIINNIFTDFINYLKHHSFKVELIKKNVNITLKVSDSSAVYILNYITLMSEFSEIIPSAADLIIIDSEQLDIRKNKINSKMIIDYQKRERIGTSNLGEEFVTFISRYGIRFNRLD